MNEPAEHASPTWLVVLPPWVSEEELTRLLSAIQVRGWTADSSRGGEQAVVAVRGPRNAAELESVLGGCTEVDVLQILEGAQYKRLRARRRFLSALVASLGLLIVAGLILPLVGFLQPPPGTIFAPELVRVPKAVGLAVGGATLVRLGDKPVLVLRTAPERWHAVSASCTFMDDCTLEWDAGTRQILCPCHGCAFDIHGNVVHAPASLPLVRLMMVESGGSLFVRRTL